MGCGMSGVLVRVSALVCLALVQAVAHGAEARSPEAKEIEQFVKALYSYPISKFEFPKQVNGSSDFDKSCELLRSFLDVKLTERSEGRSCRLATRSLVESYFRYPSAEQDDMGDINKVKKPFKYKIETIKADSNNGVAKVFIPQNDWGVDSRIVYFLSKTDRGWRIVNLLAYRVWPLDLKGERSDCRDQSRHYYFAQPPASEAYLEDLPRPCRTLEIDEWRRIGKTRW